MITKEETLKMSELARISITNQEVDRFTDSINDILSFVDMIYDIQHENVDFLGLNELKNCLRDDQIEPSLTNEQALIGTKYNLDGYFEIRKGV